MIAADTSTWIAYLEGGWGKDVELLDKALADRQVLMVPVVLAELLSDPETSCERGENPCRSSAGCNPAGSLGKGRSVAGKGAGKAPQGSPG